MVDIFNIQYRTEHGPHKGWTTYYFTMYDLNWRLLTVHDDEPHSLIILDESSHVRRHQMPAPWKYFSFSKFLGILEPTAAMMIIQQLVRFHAEGVADGKNAKIDELMAVLLKKG